MYALCTSTAAGKQRGAEGTGQPPDGQRSLLEPQLPTRPTAADTLTERGKHTYYQYLLHIIWYQCLFSSSGTLLSCFRDHRLEFRDESEM